MVRSIRKGHEVEANAVPNHRGQRSLYAAFTG